MRPITPLLCAVLLAATACARTAAPPPAPPPPADGTQPSAAPTGPTAAEAAAFVDSAEAVLMDLAIRAERASWVQSTYITHDTEILNAEAQERLIAARVPIAKRAARFQGVQLPFDVARKLDLFRTAITTPAPSDPARRGEVTRLAASMESQYGRGRYCPPGGGECMDLEQLSDIIASSRDARRLLEAWVGWHSIAPPMRDEYTRFVELTNEGARELGYADVGALWRSQYDMSPEEFAREVDRLWEQVRPLYESLHCYVRAELAERYGEEVVQPGEPIPAHLLGNMWAQEWGNIYDLVAPRGVGATYDLTRQLRARGYTPVRMVKQAEGFFTSLGMAPLPPTFWERSLFVKPQDRDVVCHASAWDIDQVEDLRIKMCIDVTAEDFQTIHHELGHNYYQRAYNKLPYLYRGSANDGFHEALGDAIALSVTPNYLRQIGLIAREPDASRDVGLLLRDAMDKVAFLPFGLLIDQWRWKVFSGEISPQQYNQGWWALRERYQGVKAPVARTEEHFDPAAKYHVAANVPYTRYFLARILQFQFHRSLCQAAGHQGPLHRCSIYGNREAGRRLQAMMEMGQSRPWPEALHAITGQREIDATAMLDYFAPLKIWLDQQNAGRQCGWRVSTPLPGRTAEE
ncbi:MAG TPA: M2 family metallopeptidase [Longimicrobiaceae bacterium]|nr:M2 family metallopeptidase [Longimicrobiaceae bacterium]